MKSAYCERAAVGAGSTQTAARLSQLGRLSQWPLCLATTTNAFDADRQVCSDAGMHDPIAKPVEPDKLHETLFGWLEKCSNFIRTDFSGTGNSLTASEYSHGSLSFRVHSRYIASINPAYLRFANLRFGSMLGPTVPLESRQSQSQNAAHGVGHEWHGLDERRSTDPYTMKIERQTLDFHGEF